MSLPVQPHSQPAMLVDPAGVQEEGVNKVASYVWDPVGLAWVKATAGGGGGGGAVTVADGADVAEGSTADPAWVSGAGTVISLLKKIASAGGSAVSVADGADVAEGATADAAVTGDAAGTVSAKLRGINKEIAATMGLAIPLYDYASLAQGSTTDTWTYKSGGAGGTTVATLTITYTDATKAVIQTIART